MIETFLLLPLPLLLLLIPLLFPAPSPPSSSGSKLQVWWRYKVRLEMCPNLPALIASLLAHVAVRLTDNTNNVAATAIACLRGKQAR